VIQTFQICRDYLSVSTGGGQLPTNPRAGGVPCHLIITVPIGASVVGTFQGYSLLLVIPAYEDPLNHRRISRGIFLENRDDPSKDFHSDMDVQDERGYTISYFYLHIHIIYIIIPSCSTPC
jgi:hypothetical protein